MLGSGETKFDSFLSLVMDYSVFGKGSPPPSSDVL